MAKNSGFNEILKPATDPVVANGDLLVSSGNMVGHAAQVKAQGDAIGQKTETDLMSAAGGLALEAYKGHLESDMESSIRQTIDDYKNTLYYDNATSQLEILQNTPPEQRHPEAVNSAIADIQKYGSAIKQGTMTREQALLAIDTTVKDYSNKMPGWAKEFRSQAAQITGVPHMGNYVEYNLLAEGGLAAQREKNALALEQKLVGNFIETYGRMPVGGMRGADMQMFAQQKTIQAQADRLKNEIQIRDATLAQNEPKVNNIIGFTMADGIMTLNTKMQGIVNATAPDGKPIPPTDKVVLRQQVVSDVNGWAQTMTASIMSFNANQISPANREQQLNRVESVRKSLIDSLQNQDAFDDFKKTMEIQSLQAKNIMDKFWLANAHLKPLKESGVITPDLVKFYMDSQGDANRAADFKKRYPQVAEFLGRVTSGSAEVYQANVSKGVTNPTHLAALRETSPAEFTIAMHTMSDTIQRVAQEGWGDTQETQRTRKDNFSNYINTFASQINPNEKGSVEQWNKLFSNPAVAQRIKELSPVQQQAAVGGIVGKTRDILEHEQFGLLKKLSGLIEANSSDRAQFKIVYNPTTNLFEGKIEAKTPGRMRASRELASGAVVYEDATPTNTNVPAYGEFLQTINTVNRSLGIISNMKDFKGIIPEEMANRGLVKDYFNKFQAGFFNMPQGERQSGVPVNQAPGTRVNINTPQGMRTAITGEDPYGHLGKAANATADMGTENGIRLQLLELQDELKKTSNATAVRILREEMLRLEDQLKELTKPKESK